MVRNVHRPAYSVRLWFVDSSRRTGTSLCSTLAPGCGSHHLHQLHLPRFAAASLRLRAYYSNIRDAIDLILGKSPYIAISATFATTPYAVLRAPPGIPPLPRRVRLLGRTAGSLFRWMSGS